jgi:hypothetical protein
MGESERGRLGAGERWNLTANKRFAAIERYRCNKMHFVVEVYILYASLRHEI